MALPAYIQDKKLLFAELLISLRRVLSMWLENIIQKRQQKHKYVECI